MLFNYQFQVNIANSNLDLLAPGVKKLVQEAIAACWTAGLEVYVFEGWRSPERQDWLRKQNTASRTVSRAGAGFSFHQWGLAVDIAFGGQGRWSWNGDFEKVKQIFIRCGFDPPPSFEQGHFQISKGYKIGEIQTMALASTVQGLWTIMGLDRV